MVNESWIHTINGSPANFWKICCDKDLTSRMYRAAGCLDYTMTDIKQDANRKSWVAHVLIPLPPIALVRSFTYTENVTFEEPNGPYRFSVDILGGTVRIAGLMTVSSCYPDRLTRTISIEADTKGVFGQTILKHIIPSLAETYAKTAKFISEHNALSAR